MNAEESRLLHAYLDGELDPPRAVAFEARLAQDAGLRAAYERLRELSSAIREEADYHAAPAELSRAFSEQAPRARRSWLQPALALAAAVLLGIAVGFFLPRGAGEEALARELVASHVRATLSDRMIDVASSDQHTVKPWLSARLPFSPPVSDFSGEGFPLVGARVEYVGGKPAAVLVYKRRRHTIDVFVSPDVPSGRAASARDGFNVERFSAQGMGFALVSDLNRNELEDFARLLAGRS
ncbi:MAG TPA: anti-sigma factor [Burkholderiales bacterium]|nr:anti-sigma factor [Burkholderiales bacterium]